MENIIFRKPAVAGVMKAHFVESRHHTDTQNTLTEAQFAKNHELQDRLAGTKANPFFVVVEPKSGKVLGTHSLSGGPSAWEGNWLAFLNQMIAAAGRAK